MIELVVRFIFFFIVLIGLIEFCFIKLKIKSEFIPIILFSSIALIMFFAGLLNVMLEALVILVLFSLIYLSRLIIKREFSFKVLTPGMLYFIGFALYLAFFLKGAKFVAYDDFSHWGLVARDILTNNKFPNFESLIVFQAYPTGSASFIYFVSKIIGETEGVILYAQSLLVLSGIIPLFVFVKKNKFIGYIMIFLSSIFFLTSNVGFLALSVDTLLSILCIAASAMIIYGYKTREYKWVYLQILPILSLLMIIKNSGILFVIINVLLLIYFSLKYEKNKVVSMQKFLLTLGVPYVVKFLWEKHVQLVFSRGFESKHAMSTENYKNIFHEKTVEDIQLIVTKFIERAIDIHQVEIKILLLCLIGFLLINLFVKLNWLTYKETNNVGFKLFFSSVVLYYVYQLGLLSTYIFSMPMGEAINLASYGRYNLTIVMYIFGMLLIYLLSVIDENKFISTHYPNKIIFIMLGMLLITIPLYLKHPAGYDLVKKEEYVQQDRSTLATVYYKNKLVPNEKYLIYLSNHPEINWASYFYYVSLYTLHSSDIKIITDEKINEIDSINTKTNLIILREDDLIKNKLNDLGIKEYKQFIQLD